MKSSSYQSTLSGLVVVCLGFGYEDAEHICRLVVVCLGFGYEDAESIVPKMVLYLGFWICES